MSPSDKSKSNMFEGKKSEGSVGQAASFDAIYKNKLWGRKGGGSGPGSELSAMWPAVIQLAHFISDHQINHIVDLSCGAMAWWPTAIALSKRDVRFTGFDISKVVISRNKERLASFTNIEFKQGDALTCQIGPCDLLVCRETLNHLPMDHAQGIIKRMAKAHSQYYCLSQNRSVEQNADDTAREIKVGSAYKYTEWNFSLPPFDLGTPFTEIPENRGRSLAIYKSSQSGN